MTERPPGPVWLAGWALRIGPPPGLARAWLEQAGVRAAPGVSWGNAEAA